MKALLIVNPDNPLGRVLDVDTLSMLVDFANANKIHLVVDEIYALSVFDA